MAKNDIKTLSYTEINKRFSSSSLSFSYFDTEPIEPMVMYNDIFSSLELEEKGKQETGKYNLILLKMKYDFKTKEKKGVIPVAIHNGLNELKQIINSDTNDFCVMSCISYAGNKNNHILARYMYALVIDLDDLIKSKKYDGLHTLDIYCGNGRIKTPNYIVSSGHGLHLYYVFEKPVPMYQRTQNLLFELKKELVKQVWTNEVSATEEQHGNIIQGFRVAGTKTKDLKHKTKCYKVYDNKKREIKKYTPYDLSTCCINIKDKKKYFDMTPKSNLTLAQAQKKYPEWYKKRIIKKQPKGKWNINKRLYEWWLEKIINERKLGHRYYCCMCLVIYAIKCNIEYEKVKKDLYNLQKSFDFEKSNPFTKQDIKDALKIYNDNVATYTRARMELLSDIPMPPNKRNGLPQKEHLKIARHFLKIKNKLNKKTLQGRKARTEQNEIIDFMIINGTDTKKVAKHFKLSIRQAQRYKKTLKEMRQAGLLS